jgi:hypothetical protein
MREERIEIILQDHIEQVYGAKPPKLKIGIMSSLPYRSIDIDFNFDLLKEITKGIKYYPSYKSWSEIIREIGYELMRLLFFNNPNLYNEVLKESLKNARKEGIPLHLIFSGPGDFLYIPWELMYEKNDKNYLAEDCIISRKYNLRTLMPDRQYLSEPHLEDQLNILFILNKIAPNDEKYSFIPDVEKEVKLLKHFFSRLNHNRKKPISIDEACNIADIRRMKKQWDIIHYVGFSPLTENCSLYFNSKGDCSECKKSLNDALCAKDIWKVIDLTYDRLKFLYLSCCENGGIPISCERKGMSLNHPGYGKIRVIQSFLEKKVPSILGYRWKVSDTRSHKLAYSFYKHLFKEKCSLAHALYLAKKDMRKRWEQYNAWISPMLIIYGEDIPDWEVGTSTENEGGIMITDLLTTATVSAGMKFILDRLGKLIDRLNDERLAKKKAELENMPVETEDEVKAVQKSIVELKRVLPEDRQVDSLSAFVEWAETQNEGFHALNSLGKLVVSVLNERWKAEKDDLDKMQELSGIMEELRSDVDSFEKEARKGNPATQEKNRLYTRIKYALRVIK